MFKTIIVIMLVGFLVAKTGTLVGQEERARYIGVESGIDFHFCKSNSFDFIRGSVDVSTYGINEGENNLTMLFQKWYIGANTEFRCKNDKAGFLTGLRFSQVNSSIGKSTDWPGTSSFFYLLNKQEGTTTEFLKVKEINQTSNYMGIPIELRYSFINLSSFDIYIKASTEISYRLSTTTDVVFYNTEMEPFQEEVADKFGQPKNLLLGFNGALGFKFGKKDRPNFNIEAVLPSYILTKKTSGLVDPLSGGGIQFNIQFPF